MARRKPRKRKSAVSKEPMLLSEDRMRRHAMDTRVKRVRQVKREAPRVQGTKNPPASRKSAEERLMRALKTLRAVPDRDRKALGLRSGMPEYVRDFTAYDTETDLQPKFIPTPTDISDYLEALSWTRHLPGNDWRLLWLRSFDLSFGLIAEYIGRSDETARRRFEGIITDVWCAANNVGSGKELDRA